MKIKFFAIVILLLFLGCESPPPTGSKSVKKFSLSEVRLTEGPFLHAIELNKASLLKYDPDRLLARFRKEAGLEPRAEHYGGWEAESLAGHTLGHHLSACALMFQTSNDSAFYNRANYIVQELSIIQEANGNGYLGAFTDGMKIFEEEVSKGVIRSQGFNLNGIWSPFYTHHKVLAGLRDAYRLLDIDLALSVEAHFADWIYGIVSPLTDSQTQEMLHCEFGGMNEVLVDLFVDTGVQRYMDLADKFYHEEVLQPLSEKSDNLSGLHGNTQIPKLIGLARRFEVLGDSADYETSTFFWDRVVNHHSYVTGGHGNHEYFGDPDKLNFRLSDETSETCNVYNMLKLTSHFFQWSPSSEIGDFYERALFNHILASQEPNDGRVIYNLSLEMGGKKTYQNPEWFTCCVGSGMETHSKYGRNIYYHNDNELYVNQFIASEVFWKEKRVSLIQNTGFPKSHETELIINSERTESFILKIRYPYWSEKSPSIELNDQVIEVKKNEDGFITIERNWTNGDRVKIKWPFTLRVESMPDNPNRIALMYGPLVLAADLGPEDDTGFAETEYVPVIISNDRDPNTWLEPLENPNQFKLSEVGFPRDVSLKPFYEIHHRRYSVYLDLYNEESYQNHKNSLLKEKERKSKLAEKTFDWFQPGIEQEEIDHHFEGDSVYIQEFRNKKSRVANRGGEFQFEMKIKPDEPMSLAIEYWGGFTGSKTFDILIDGELLATEDISGKADGCFIDVFYPIPEKLTKGKDRILVQFKPHLGHRAGPVFMVRTLESRYSELESSGYN